MIGVYGIWKFRGYVDFSEKGFSVKIKVRL